MSDIKLLHGDCMEQMESMESGSIDCVVTSPPYNLGIEYNEYNDDSDRENYLSWIHGCGTKIADLLSPEGSLFLNVGSMPTDPWVPHEVISTLRDIFQLQNEIHWIKSIAVQQESYEEEVAINVGHYKPINSPRFINQCHEYIFHLTLSGDVPLDRTAIGVPYKDKSNVERWDSGGKDLRCRGNTWFIPYQTISNRSTDRPHPATFPPALAEMAMKLHGLDRIDQAMDPFLGIGSSALAASRLDCDFIGIELDETYLDETKNRLKKEGIQTTLDF